MLKRRRREKRLAHREAVGRLEKRMRAPEGRHLLADTVTLKMV